MGTRRTRSCSTPGIAGRLTEVIERLAPAIRPNLFTLHGPGPSRTKQLDQKSAPMRHDSSDDDDDDDDPQPATTRSRKRPKNPFILDEAIEADNNGEEENADLECDYNDYEFIDDDD